MKVLLGMELCNLIEFNEFMSDYEKLAFKCVRVEDGTLKLNRISKVPFLILDKVHIIPINKNSHIEEMHLVEFIEVIRICIGAYCMDKESMKKLIKNKFKPKDCKCFSYVNQYGKQEK
jgi:hypothetical protein